MSAPGADVDMCLVPLQMPPANVLPNFVNPENLVAPTIVVSIVFTALCVAFMVGRLAQNLRKMRSSDYMAIVGFILSSAYTGIVIALRKFSRHAWNVPMCWYLTDSPWQLLFASNMLLGPTQFFVKVAILLLYFQLFATTKVTKASIIAACVLSGFIYLVHPIMVIVFTAPRNGAAWITPALNGMSNKLKYYAPIHGVGSVVLDLWILAIPIPAISKLQVSKKKKIQLLVVFVTGFLGVISSIISCYWRFKLVLDEPGDSTWYQGQLLIWIVVEHNVAIMVGAMPAFAGMIKTHVSPSFVSITSKLRGATSRGGFSAKGSLPTSSKYPSSYDSSGVQRSQKSHVDYYELDEPSPFDSRIMAGKGQRSNSLPHDEEQGILRITQFEQRSFHASVDGESAEAPSYRHVGVAS